MLGVRVGVVLGIQLIRHGDEVFTMCRKRGIGSKGRKGETEKGREGIYEARRVRKHRAWNVIVSERENMKR